MLCVSVSVNVSSSQSMNLLTVNTVGSEYQRNPTVMHTANKKNFLDEKKKDKQQHRARVFAAVYAIVLHSILLG